jgi:multisubunit Na+/H+ antiporter MnhC subunit
MLWNLPYIVVVVTTMIGLVTILFKQNLIKVLLGINGFEAKLLASENR